jgi:hypothetical protein
MKEASLRIPTIYIMTISSLYVCTAWSECLHHRINNTIETNIAVSFIKHGFYVAGFPVNDAMNVYCSVGIFSL